MPVHPTHSPRWMLDISWPTLRPRMLARNRDIDHELVRTGERRDDKVSRVAQANAEANHSLVVAHQPGLAQAAPADHLVSRRCDRAVSVVVVSGGVEMHAQESLAAKVDHVPRAVSDDLRHILDCVVTQRLG